MAFSMRKNATPPSAQSLREEAEAERATQALLEAQLAQVAAERPDLVGYPALAAEADAKQAALERELMSSRKTLALFVDAIAEAEAREARDDLLARQAKQERASAKLARELERKYPAAVQAIVELIREVAADEDAWSVINRELQSLGLVGGVPAEERARGEFRRANHWLYRPLTDALIPAFEGGMAWEKQ